MGPTSRTTLWSDLQYRRTASLCRVSGVKRERDAPDLRDGGGMHVRRPMWLMCVCAGGWGALAYLQAFATGATFLLGLAYAYAG